MTTSAKPICGYESQSAAIRAMLAQNIDRRVIATRLGVPMTRYSALEATALRSGGIRKKPRALGARLSRDLTEKARRHARRRGLSVQEFLHALVETVLTDDIVDAVLDDK